jgi:MtrB/PioB family decaheme-associated outer membrane protein
MMSVKNIIRSAALASTCLVPLVGFAQDDNAADKDNEISVGAQYQSGSSAMFGRYNGDWNGGGRGTLDFSLNGGSAWNSGGTYRYTVYGRNLDYSAGNVGPEAQVGFKVGQQGKWNVGLDYNAITYFQSDNFQSVWQSGGDGLLNPGIKPGSYNSWQANLVPLTSEDVKTRRDRYTLTGKYDLGDGFSVETKLFHEHKEGTMEYSMSIGGLTSSLYPVLPGNVVPHSALAGAPAASTSASALGVLAYFPEPIDWDNDRYDVTLKYKSGNLYSQVGYSFMKFTNANSGFYAMDPFSLAGPGATATQRATLYNQPGQAAFGLQPNNYQNTVNGDFSYSFTPTTVLSGAFEYAWEVADNPLPLNGLALNPNLTPTAAQAQLIANPIAGVSDQWNATARVMNGNLTFTSKPLDHVEFRASYLINTYVNDTMRTAMYNAGDVIENTAIPATTLAQLQATNCNGASVDACTVPWAWTKQKSTADINYEVFKGTKLGFGYTYYDNDHKYMLNDHYTEQDFAAKLNTRFTPEVFANLVYEHGDRNAKAQNLGAAPNAPLEIPALFQNNGAAMWFDSSRISNTVRGKLSWAAADTLDLAINGQWVDEHYPDIQNAMVGMTRDMRESVGPQIGWRPIPEFSTTLFYNYERLSYDSASVYGTICSNAAGVATVTVPSVAAPNPVCAAGTVGQSGAAWTQTNRTTTNTFGASLEWQANEKLKLGATYNYSQGNISWDYADNILPATLSAMNPYYQYAWAAQGIPSVTSTLNSFKLHGEYSFTPTMSLFMQYAYERFSNNDYQNAVNQASYASALLSGDATPRYDISVVSAALRLKF